MTVKKTSSYSQFRVGRRFYQLDTTKDYLRAIEDVYNFNRYKTIHFGLYETAEEASRAYEEGIKNL